MDSSGGETPSNGNENLDEPKDLSWLAQRAAMAGMGITPIDTQTLHPPRRMARVNSWGRHTTSLDPIYNERKGSNDSEKIRRLLNGRFTSVDDEEKEEEEKVGKEGGFSSTHLEQIFSPSWGEETEAWQRERLKQWVIWAEEQERTARVRETYVVDSLSEICSSQTPTKTDTLKTIRYRQRLIQN